MIRSRYQGGVPLEIFQKSPRKRLMSTSFRQFFHFFRKLSLKFPYHLQLLCKALSYFLVLRYLLLNLMATVCIYFQEFPIPLWINRRNQKENWLKANISLKVQPLAAFNVPTNISDGFLSSKSWKSIHLDFSSHMTSNDYSKLPLRHGGKD